MEETDASFKDSLLRRRVERPIRINPLFWRCSFGCELVLTDDIRHADPLLNSKVLISSEHSIPTSISLSNMQLSSLFNKYTLLSFRRGPPAEQAHSIRCLSDHHSPARIALLDIHVHYSSLWLVHICN